MKRFGFLLVAVAMISPSASMACVPVADGVRAWVQCAYAEAYRTDDHRFMVSMAKAKVHEKRLKETSEPRWNALEQRVEGKCGSFADAAAKSEGSKSGYVPDSVFMAIWDTSDRDKLVKS